MIKNNFFLLAAFSSMITLIYIISMGAREISLRLIMDDAFYYYQIAYNIINGYGSTFDRIHYTNGYHPLWLIISVIAGFVVGNKEYFIISIIIVQFFFFWLGAYNGIKAIKIGLRTDIEVPLLSTLFIIASTPIFSKMFLGGLESSLYWATIMIALNFNRIAFKESGKQYWIYYGLILGIMFLSRIDSLILVINWTIFMLLVSIRQNRLEKINTVRNMINVLAPVTLIILIYLSINIINYGHLMSSSAAIKLSPSFKYLIYQVPLLLIWITISWRGSHPKNKNIYFIIPFLTFALIYLPILLFFGPNEINRIWYHIPTIVSIWILMNIILKFGREKLRIPFLSRYFIAIRYSIVIGCVVLAIIGFFCLKNSLNSNRFVKWRHDQIAAIWLSEKALREDIVASFDGGRIGFTIPQRTINLDGLVNSHDYAKVVEKRELWNYLVINKVRFIINHVNGDENLISSRLKPLDPKAPWEMQSKIIYDDLFEDPREGMRRIQVIEINIE